MAPPPINRVDWSIVNGQAVETMLIIAGVPALFLHANSVLSSVPSTVWSDPSAGVDPAWWPSSSYVAPFAVQKWVKPGPLDIGFRARPVDGTVECQPVTRTLYDSGVPGTTALTIGNVNAPSPTALFTSKASLIRTPLTASFGLTDGSISVVSTAQFTAAYGSSNFLVYIGLETVLVAVTSATTLGVVSGGRGLFGSVVQNHPGSTNQGLVSSNVWSGLPNILNRRATVWAVYGGANGPWNPTILFDGIVGAGSKTDGATFKVRINSVLNSLSAKAAAPVLTISGYSHQGYTNMNGAAGPNNIPARSQTPLAVLWVLNDDGPGRLALLTDNTSHAYNRGGYHPDLLSFVGDWNYAALDAQSGVSGQSTYARLNPDGTLTIICGSSTSSKADIFADWLPAPYYLTVGDGPSVTYNLGPFPTAYQVLSPLLQNVVYFTLSDMAQIPITTTGPVDAHVTGGPPTVDQTQVWYTLFVPVGSATVPARVFSYDASTHSTYGYGTMNCGPWGYVAPGQPSGTITVTPDVLVTQPTTATLGFFTQSQTWWSAIWGLAVTMSKTAGFGANADQFDWTRIAQVASEVSTPFDTGRSYPVDATQKSTLDLFKNEVRLNGMVLSPYFGRAACCRITDTGSTTTAQQVIYKQDLRADGMSMDSENADGLLSSFKVSFPDGQQTITFNDQIDMGEFGVGQAITADYYGGLASNPNPINNPSATGTALAFANLGQHAIGPWCQTYRIVTVPLSVKFAGLQIGDVVRFGDSNGGQGDWILPNGTGGRGLSGAVGTVIGTKLSLFSNDNEGKVDIDVRLSSNAVANYAPELLVSGISGGVLTVDTTTWGPNGFASQYAGALGTGTGDAGAAQFRLGDVCQLLNVNTTSPMTPFNCTVTGISGTTITVSPSPSSGWVTAASTPLSVMLSFVEDYDSATNTGQHNWLWIADSTTLLVGTSAPVPAFPWAP